MRRMAVILIFLTVNALFNFSKTQGAPYVSSVTDSIFDGGNAVISGAGFGSNNLDFEWLGGASGTIESGADGGVFNKSGWLVPIDSSSAYSPRYSTTKAHSHNKSIMSSWPDSNHYTSHYVYDTGGAVGTLYASWWVYFDHVDSAGQWKQWRVRPDNSVGDVDGEIYRNNWYSDTAGCTQAQVYLFCDYSDYTVCYPTSNGGLRWTTCEPRDSWYRVELYIKESSDVDVRDGSFVWRVHNQSNTINTLQNWNGTIITRETGGSQMRYIVFQNYWGNISSGTGTKEKVYIDDIFIQTGTQARVEIGDAANFDNCVQREIQVPITWSDTSITVTVNRGSFDPCQTYYLYIVDENGSVNADGFPIKIVTGAVEQPCPPEKKIEDSSIIQ